MSSYRIFVQAYRHQARRTVLAVSLTPASTPSLMNAPVLALPAGPSSDAPVQQQAA